MPQDVRDSTSEWFDVGSPLPDAVAMQLPRSFASHFVSDPMFVGVDGRLSRAQRTLSAAYALPRLCVDWVEPDLAMCTLRFDSDTHTLWAPVHSRDTYELTPVEEVGAALPENLTSLYRWLDGIQKLPAGGSPSIGWHDTPCMYSSRRDLWQALPFAGVKKSIVDRIYRRMDSRSLLIWMFGSRKDILFTDESNMRKKIFHLRAEEPEAIGELDDEAVDLFVAHALTSDSRFDFEGHARSL